MREGSFIGNVGAEPDIRYTTDGQLVVNFSIAVNDKVKGEQKTTWIRISVWGRLAETVSDLVEKGWLNKGRQVFVRGRIDVNQYEKDGKHFANLECMANDVRLLGGAQQSSEE